MLLYAIGRGASDGWTPPRINIHNPATGLGQQFIQIERMLVQHGLPAAQAAKAAMGQLLGEIFNPHGPIFQAGELQQCDQ